jgi:hypothetical protein
METYLDHLSCPICLDVINDAVETQCCHQIGCQECMKYKSCPLCRADNCTTVPSYPIRRIILSIPIKCQNCDYNTTRGELPNHTVKCPNRKLKCVICFQEFPKSEFLPHAVEIHPEELMKFLTEQVNEPNPVREVLGDRNIIGIKKNHIGREARIGESGKHYCGGNLNIDCSCCNGYCGPTNGCNCVWCMKLDIKSRSLPDNYMINREGRAAKRYPNGRVYCGARVLVGNPHSDGYCGPTNGPSCKPCQILANQWTMRYAGAHIS